MQSKGQLQLEAVAGFLAFLAVLSIALNAVSVQLDAAAEAGSKLEAEMRAEACALVVDSVFSNSGGSLSSLKMDCFDSRQHFVRSSVHEMQGEGFTLARELKSIQVNETALLEVSVDAHYK